MIVLDEQLLGRGLETAIARWYPGKVQFVIDLRPRSVIKDDAIPELLRQQSQPTFVTINAVDFWRKIEADRRFCMICFDFPDSRVLEIPDKLRAAFRRPELGTKAERMGKIVRVTENLMHYYTIAGMDVVQIELT